MTDREHTYTVGDRAVAVYPAGSRPGTVVATREGLGFVADSDKLAPTTWAMPVDERGRCTYPTHRHVYLTPEVNQ